MAMNAEDAPDTPPQQVMFFVDQETIDAALKEALTTVFVRSEHFQRAVDDQIRMMVRQELMRNNEVLDGLREDIQKMLARFPSIMHDPEMMTTVARSLIGHFQQ